MEVYVLMRRAWLDFHFKLESHGVGLDTEGFSTNGQTVPTSHWSLSVPCLLFLYWFAWFKARAPNPRSSL